MHQQPAADLASVDDPEVDMADLGAQLRRSAAQKRDLGLYGGVPADDAAGEPPELRFGPRVSSLATGAEILPYGPPVSGLKRAIRRALRWYLWPITAHMSGHNRAVAEVAVEHERQLAWLRMELERLYADAGAPSPPRA
jgi:hypothetical protein